MTCGRSAFCFLFRSESSSLKVCGFSSRSKIRLVYKWSIVAVTHIPFLTSLWVSYLHPRWCSWLFLAFSCGQVRTPSRCAGGEWLQCGIRVQQQGSSVANGPVSMTFLRLMWSTEIDMKLTKWLSISSHQIKQAGPKNATPKGFEKFVCHFLSDEQNTFWLLWKKKLFQVQVPQIKWLIAHFVRSSALNSWEEDDKAQQDKMVDKPIWKKKTRQETFQWDLDFCWSTIKTSQCLTHADKKDDSGYGWECPQLDFSIVDPITVLLGILKSRRKITRVTASKSFVAKS